MCHSILTILLHKVDVASGVRFVVVRNVVMRGVTRVVTSIFKRARSVEFGVAVSVALDVAMGAHVVWQCAVGWCEL